MLHTEPEITRDLLIRAKRIALRTGKWFRLHPVDRAVLTLSIRVVSRVRSPALRGVIVRVLNKISDALALKLVALRLGYELAKRRVRQAVMLGHSKASEWLRDLSYVWYLGFTHAVE